ncbi:MAG: hypothetical protein K2V38_22785, partial [Gemmataceae bacterium]|nr:hypothetical protein [Gemmataceae bacterium]
ALVGGAEYFTSPTLGNSSNTTWLNLVYADLLGVTNVAATAGGASLVAALNAGTLTRAQLANLLAFNDQVLQRVVSDYFVALLGRAPVRNPDPAADETAFFLPLLKRPAAGGQLSGDQQVIQVIAAAPEYLRVNGASNFNWLKCIDTRVLGRTTIDTSTATGTEFNGVLDNLLLAYLPARDSVLAPLVASLEYRNKVYAGYYAQFLAPPGGTRTPTAGELATAETVYQSGGQRLEAVVAFLFGTDEFYPTSGPGSLNSGWLSKVYGALLGRGTANDPLAASQLATLNAASQANLVATRRQIALSILNSTEYRGILVNSLYVGLLGRPATTAERDFWVGRMNNPAVGDTQQTITRFIMQYLEYYRFRAL